MAKKINKKKIVGNCPVGITKTFCPSIKKTRRFNIELMRLQRRKDADQEQIERLRQLIKEKKNRGISVDCDTCYFNTAKGRPTVAS